MKCDNVKIFLQASTELSRTKKKKKEDQNCLTPRVHFEPLCPYNHKARGECQEWTFFYRNQHGVPNVKKTGIDRFKFMKNKIFAWRY